MNRTDSAIAVQSELQRTFIGLARTIYPLVYSTIRAETPRWLKLACHDGYFSSGTYRQTRICKSTLKILNISTNFELLFLLFLTQRWETSYTTKTIIHKPIMLSLKNDTTIHLLNLHLIQPQVFQQMEETPSTVPYQ